MSLDHDTREATSTNLDDALAGLLPSESSVAPPSLPHQTGAHVPSGSLAPVDGVVPEWSPATFPTAGSIEQRPSSAWWRRYGAWPYLAVTDVVLFGTVTYLWTGRDGYTLLAVAVLLVAARTLGLYRDRLSVSGLDDLPLLLACTLMCAPAVVLARPGGGVTGATLALWAVCALLALVIGRSAAYAGLRRARRHGLLTHRALILGVGDVGLSLAAAMIEHPEYGLRPVGFIDDSPLVPSSGMPLPVLGNSAGLASVIEEQGVDHVIIAFTATREIELVETVRTCDRLDCEISVVPRLFELMPRTSHNDDIHGVPLARLARAPFRSFTWPLKRAMDIGASAFAILLLSPILLLVAALVRFVDGPGIVFRQERIGIDGRPFELLKFRSLRPSTAGEGDVTWNIKGHREMSWVGALIRKSSLDELLQLFNILRGDMSIVGPRPERPFFVAQFEESLIRYGNRHRVPSGLTGWAQIHGLRGDTSIAERARFDNYYIENWSLWLDVKIILRTIPNMMKGSG